MIHYMHMTLQQHGGRYQVVPVIDVCKVLIKLHGYGQQHFSIEYGRW